MKFFLKRFQNEKIVMHSAYSVEDCIERLKAEVTDPLSIKSIYKANAIIGTISENYLDIRANSLQKNSFRRSLKANIEDYSNGAKITGEFSINPIVKLLFFVFISLMAAISLICVAIILIILSAILLGGSADTELLFRLILTALFFPFMLWFFKSATISSDNEVLFIKQFLKGLLGAEEITDDNNNKKLILSSNT